MDRIMDVMEQIKKLRSSPCVKSLLASASEILGNPMALFDTEYRLLEHTDVVTDDPLWNELMELGIFSKESQMMFASEGFVEEVANVPRVALLLSDKLKYDRMNGKVFNKNNTHVANIILIACKKPFEEDDAKVFESVCKLISREISKSEFYQEYEQTHQERVIKGFIDGTFDRGLALGQAEIIYDSLDSSLYLAVADLSQCDPEQTQLAFYRDLFMKIQPEHKYAIYSPYIVMIISTNDGTLDVQTKMQGLRQVFEQHSIYVGLSGCFENLFELKRYYLDALKALQYVMESKSDQRIFPHNPKSMATMAQIRALPSGKGIQYFADIAPDILGNPVLFHDMELKLIACTKNAEFKDPICEELITYGTVSDESFELLRREGFYDSVEGTKAGTLLVSDKLPYDRISGKIYNQDNIMVGCLCMILVAGNKPPKGDELALFAAFCEKFSQELRGIAFFSDYGQLYSGTIINRLLDGHISGYGFFSEDIENLYDTFMDNLHLVVIDTSKCNREQIGLTFIRDLFNRLDTINRYAIYKGNTIVIISTEGSSLGRNRELDYVNQMFEQHNIYAGISSRFDNIYELRKHYDQAVSALTDGIQNHPNSQQRIFGL